MHCGCGWLLHTRLQHLLPRQASGIPRGAATGSRPSNREPGGGFWHSAWAGLGIGTGCGKERSLPRLQALCGWVTQGKSQLSAQPTVRRPGLKGVIIYHRRQGVLLKVL